MTDPYEGFPRTGDYRTIICDPPWPYLNRFRGGRQKGSLPYEAMTEDEIFGLPVSEAAAGDSILLLWTTNSHMALAIECVRHYGFETKTILTWGKTDKAGKVRFGTGFWLRGATEHALFATRGRPRSQVTRALDPEASRHRAWSTLLLSPRREHSRKPDEAYVMLEDLGEAPRIELFARSRRQGWDAWGDHPTGGIVGTLRDVPEVVSP